VEFFNVKLVVHIVTAVPYAVHDSLSNSEHVASTGRTVDGMSNVRKGPFIISVKTNLEPPATETRPADISDVESLHSINTALVISDLQIT
jgi:hypothetical protein